MNQVRAIRKQKKLTLNDVATAAKISIPFLSDVERGHRGAKDETMERIASALGVTVNELKGSGKNETAND